MTAIQLSFRRSVLQPCLIAVCLIATSTSIGCAQEATTPPAPTTVPAPADVPERAAVPPVEPPALPANVDLPAATPKPDAVTVAPPVAHTAEEHPLDFSSMLFVFMLATFIGLGVIMRVSRLLHTPLMSLTNAISAIAVVGAIIVTGSPTNSLFIRILGAIALFASTTNIVSGFLITDRMLKMFKQPGEGGKR